MQALSPGETNIKLLGIRNDRILAWRVATLSAHPGAAPGPVGEALLYYLTFCFATGDQLQQGGLLSPRTSRQLRRVGKGIYILNLDQ